MNSQSAPSTSSSQIYEVLMGRGWIKNIDFIMVAAEVAIPFTLRSHGLIVVLLALILVTALWILIMAYRVAYYVIILQAEIDSLPATSARLAVKFMKTLPPPSGA